VSVEVKIKQNSIFKKKLDITDVINLTGLSYGVCDENYRLIPGETAAHTLLYDKNRLARGIDASIDKTDIVLLLSLPTTPFEIHSFYHAVEKICNALKTKTYIREEEKVNLKDNPQFIKMDEEGSVAGLEAISEKLEKDKYNRFEIYGICNPISIGANEVKQIGNRLDLFEEYLHRLQSLDVYYAAPRVYRVQNKLVGIYAVGADIVSVVPTEPYIVLNQIQGVEEWYVMLKAGKTIKYKDFIENIPAKEYYDFNHVIVSLSEQDVDSLIEQCGVEL
jgi:hypothetical protein